MPIEPADLELTMTVDKPNPAVGDQIIFTLTITNDGPGVASRVEVTNLLPSELTFKNASVSQGEYNDNTGVWDVNNMINGLTSSLTITATVNNAGIFSNTAEVTAVDQIDPDSAPNNNDSNEDDQDAIIFSVNSTTGTSGNDILVGTSEDEVLTGFRGSDTLTGNGGSDVFVYESFGDRGDLITDFNLADDFIDLSQIFDGDRYNSTTPFEDYVQLVQLGTDTEVKINPVGDSRDIFRPLVILENVTATDLNFSHFIV